MLTQIKVQNSGCVWDDEMLQIHGMNKLDAGMLTLLALSIAFSHQMVVLQR